VTVTTVPMFASSVALENFSMRDLIRSLISDALIAIRGFLGQASLSLGVIATY
jgi:hypothetical protein